MKIYLYERIEDDPSQNYHILGLSEKLSLNDKTGNYEFQPPTSYFCEIDDESRAEYTLLGEANSERDVYEICNKYGYDDEYAYYLIGDIWQKYRQQLNW